MKDVNIIVGRFQPITIGHIKCAQAAFDKKNVPTVLCIIDTPENKVDKKHPFPTNFLLNIYNRILDKKLIAGIIKVKSADIVSVSEALHSNGYQAVSWSCGTDRYIPYKRMAERYKDEAQLPDDFEVLEIKRTDDDISATRLRAYLLDNDEDGFNKYFPKSNLRNVFNILREQILKVNESSMKSLKSYLIEGLFGGRQHKSPNIKWGWNKLQEGDNVWRVMFHQKFIVRETVEEAAHGCSTPKTLEMHVSLMNTDDETVYLKSDDVNSNVLYHNLNGYGSEKDTRWFALCLTEEDARNVINDIK